MAGSTFYDQIAANRRNSFLMAAFVVVLLALLGFFIGWVVFGTPAGGLVFTAAAVGLGSLSGVATYFAGDQLVLSVSGAHEITDESAPQVMNVVREMAIAANVPMPRVYIIEDTAPNAFATGRDPKHASVAVTTGLLEKLDREELQGVLGHELSHVRNYDIRFSLVVGVMVGAIAILADFFLRFTFWGGARGGRDRDSGSGSGGGAQVVIFLVAISLAILAPLISRFIQLAVSRQREYLADASSVELTRNPYGLERALAKISGDKEVLEVANRGTQHMYFTNPIKKFEARSSSLMSTHPADPGPDQSTARAHRRPAAGRGRRGVAVRARIGSRPGYRCRCAIRCAIVDTRVHQTHASRPPRPIEGIHAPSDGASTRPPMANGGKRMDRDLMPSSLRHRVLQDLHREPTSDLRELRCVRWMHMGRTTRRDLPRWHASEGPWYPAVRRRAAKPGWPSGRDSSVGRARD